MTLIDNFEEVRKRIKIERRIESQVIDRNVLLTLAYMMNRKIIDTVDFPISKGKEAYVFRATGGKKSRTKYVAVKIYMIETSRFHHMQDYILGDPRFRKVGHSKRSIVYEWTKKEFRNLSLSSRAGAHVPEPYFFRNNVLAMEYIGDDGDPAKLLKDVGPPDPEKNFNQVVNDMRKMYTMNLVHADVSEFNILVKGKKLVLIDIGQGVSIEHPMAEEFLRRDVANVVRYFKKFGVKADEEEILAKVKGRVKGRYRTE